jgi:uncharacterized protein with GYD domain
MMSRYLVQFSYTREGLEGLRKEGGSSRREAVRQLIESLGGKLEAYYYTFGSYDGVSILDMPDNATMAAASVIVVGSGAVTAKTTVLLTPEELDDAVKRSFTFRPPGE